MPKTATNRSRSNTENSEEQKPTFASGPDASGGSDDCADGHIDPEVCVCVSQCVTLQCYQLVEAVSLLVIYLASNIFHVCITSTYVVRMLVWKLCIESTLCFYLLRTVRWAQVPDIMCCSCTSDLLFCNFEMEQMFVHSYVHVIDALCTKALLWCCICHTQPWYIIVT